MSATTDLKEIVRGKYGQAASQVQAGPAACCGTSRSLANCCDPITSNLYDAGQAGEVPDAALKASLGCGNPTALAELKPGETVLDLGSGGGIDVILSARRVGPTGKAYGLDMTDEMLALAEENKRKSGLTNVEFLRGRNREHPVARQHGGRDHLELRDQPLRRQGPGAAGGVSCPEARRAVRRLGCRRARRSAGSDPEEHRRWGRGEPAMRSDDAIS